MAAIFTPNVRAPKQNNITTIAHANLTTAARTFSIITDGRCDVFSGGASVDFMDDSTRISISGAPII